MSVQGGETMVFKIKTVSDKYRLDIYRVGYYGGLGARLVHTLRPFASLPQTQPDCITEAETSLVWNLK